MLVGRFRLQGVRLDPNLANRATSDRAIFRVVTGGTPPAEGQSGAGISTRANEEDPPALRGGLPAWRLRSDVPTLWLPTALAKCID